MNKIKNCHLRTTKQFGLAINLKEALNKSLNAIKKISDTDQTIWRTTEWNICHHLACNLQEQFLELDVDVELEKDDKKRPDIVVHKRGSHKINLIIFQVKKNPSFRDILDDMNKINGTFFREPYLYNFGIFICIGKLPTKLPDFDTTKIAIIEIDGWKIIPA